MSDITEPIRRVLVEEINSERLERESLEEKYGMVWNTQQLSMEFEVMSFMAPFAMVKHRVTNAVGLLTFQHDPRYYFDFQKA